MISFWNLKEIVRPIICKILFKLKYRKKEKILMSLSQSPLVIQIWSALSHDGLLQIGNANRKMTFLLQADQCIDR